MAGWDDFVVVRQRTLYEPFGVYSSAPSIALLEKYRAFLTSNNAAGDLVYKDKTYTLQKTSKYELKDDGTIEITPLKDGDYFKISNETGYDNYKVISGVLQKTSGDVWITGRLVTGRPAISAMSPGVIYYSNALASSGIFGTTWTLSQDGGSIIEGILKSGQFIIDSETQNQSFFDGIAFKNISIPYVTSFIATKNVKIYEDDGVTPRDVPRSELYDALGLEGGRAPILSTTTQVNASTLLAVQTVETERWVYLFSAIANSATFKWYREPPTRFGVLATINAFLTVEVQRGDLAGTYRCYAKNFIPNSAVQIRAFQNNPALNTPVFWKKDDPGETERLELEKLIKQNQEKINLINEQNTPIYTTTTEITAKNKSIIIINGAGDINIWRGAVEGDFFRISDPDLKLTAIAPSVVPETGYTINGATGSYSLSAIKADWEYDRNLFFRLDNNKNWVVGRL